ncbi:UbiA family prenyltransferase [Botrimarina mediterranea]|uniref:UbiA family prenyltransferase n=1 Tax=Botrimarina mediterranea TaxID=2528022 RepID=UPI0011A7C198|nr:UbiA family prenyltransferase [Botrimarina mediterranea]
MTSVVKKIAAYAKLLRLSNAPTAVADVWMGYAVVSGELKPTWPLALMTVASLCLYHGGMALNDANDAEEDARDNRGRPIENEQVSRNTAYSLAYGLFTLAILLSFYLCILIAGFELLFITALLCAAIIAYNSRYKPTVAGPFLMAFCRFLNVQLGSSAAVFTLQTFEGKAPASLSDAYAAAFVIGCYVLGLTLFARHETAGANRVPLLIGLSISLAAIAIAATTLWIPPSVNPLSWRLMLVVAGLFSVRGMVAGILQPTPKNIGRGVGIAIQGLVVIDATLATLYAGPVAGLAILALLPVTMLLARWIPQT